MKNLAKLFAISVFGLAGVFTILVSADGSQMNSTVLAQAAATPTPAPSAPAAPAKPAAAGEKTMKKLFILSADSLSEYGDSPFDHENHAFKQYSPDGKSVVGCVECHHTDQPKSALKPPLLTSERDVVLTMDVWKTSSQPVKECRACHFQAGAVPDDKEMPTASYTDGGKTTVKDLNNELAYHINCNTCHDAAFAQRPELKQKKGFATSKDCLICHKKN